MVNFFLNRPMVKLASYESKFGKSVSEIEKKKIDRTLEQSIWQRFGRAI
jgi:hypothetical protein